MKKENILTLLEKGSRQTEKDMVTVSSGNFRCSFPKDQDTKVLSDTLKKFDRELKNQITWGHKSGAAYYRRQNDTQKMLAEMSEDRQDCRRYYRMLMEAKKAPKSLQKYVFENAIMHCKEKDVYFVNKRCSFDVVEILPLAWISGWENETLFDFDVNAEIAALTPDKNLPIDTPVTVKKNRLVLDGRIESYTIEQADNFYTTSWYGTRSYYKRGKYVVFYNVRYGIGKYDIIGAKQTEITAKISVAV